jgi:hypothetical protein
VRVLLAVPNIGPTTAIRKILATIGLLNVSQWLILGKERLPHGGQSFNR